MENKEKILIIEKVLQTDEGALCEETELSSLQQWDSLSILSLQIELSSMNPDIQFDELYTCRTIGDILSMF